MSWRRIDRDDQIKVFHNGRRIHEVIESAAKFNDVKTIGDFRNLFRSKPFLQAKKFDSGQIGEGFK